MTELESAPPGRLRRIIRAVVIVVVAIVLVGAGVLAGYQLAERSATSAVRSPTPGSSPSTSSRASGDGAAASTGRSPAPTGPTAVLVGAGDIADCGSKRDQRTAALVEDIQGIVFTAGDNAYESGSASEFQKCYGPSWGLFRDRTRPAIGNHDEITAGGGPYFAYFGTAAGAPPDGWYSYEAATWHVIVLNSNCATIGGCGAGSRELAWLTADLAAHPVDCTMAIWHHPRFSSGEHGDDPITDPFWQALFDAHAELIVNGHDHDYERFAPQTPSGVVDPVHGIREIVAGTGGKTLRPFTRPVANSEVRDATSYGVLRLDLAPGRYSWQFIATTGGSFSDSGSAICH